MQRIYLTQEYRTEHAKAVRRATGTNRFRDKRRRLRPGSVMPCVGACLTADNLVAQVYE